MTERAPELDAAKARQADMARRMFTVLLVSLALVVIGFTVLWVVYHPRLSGHGGQTSAPSQVARSFGSSSSSG